MSKYRKIIKNVPLSERAQEGYKATKVVVSADGTKSEGATKTGTSTTISADEFNAKKRPQLPLEASSQTPPKRPRKYRF